MNDQPSPDLLGQRRRLFPDIAAQVYAAHAAFTPLSRAGRAAVEAHLTAHATLGFGFVRDALAAREALRADLGALLGAPPSAIGFSQGTTAGVVAVAHALAWRPRDVVVTLDGEFPANVSPWLDAVRRHGLRHRAMPADLFYDDRGLEALERALAPGDVRLVAASAVQFQTGLAMPLAAMAALCHRHGALIFVDAIQAAGIVPLDLTSLGVDLAVGGSHKWLCGLDGAGWIYVAPGREPELARPAVGWLSHEDGARFLFEPGALRYDRPLHAAPRVFEGGSSSTAALVAMHEGVRMLRAVGVARAFAHVQRWHDLLEPAMLARGFTSARPADPARRSGILSFRPPPGVDLAALQQRLAVRGVAVNIPDGWLRLAPHFASALDEPAFVEGALDPIA